MKLEKLESDLQAFLDEVSDADFHEMPATVTTSFGEVELEYIEIDGEGFVQVYAPPLPDDWYGLLGDFDTWGTVQAWVFKVGEDAPWVGKDIQDDDQASGGRDG